MGGGIAQVFAQHYYPTILYVKQTAAVAPPLRTKTLPIYRYINESGKCICISRFLFVYALPCQLARLIAWWADTYVIKSPTV